MRPLLHLFSSPLLLSLSYAAVPGSSGLYAKDLNEDCTTTTSLPPVTVTAGGDGNYVQVYTITCHGVGPSGITQYPYPITQTCAQPACQQVVGTAPPPGVTAVVVGCDSCGPNGGAATQTLTVPTASVADFVSAGYSVGSATAAPTAPPTAPTGTGSTSTPAVVVTAGAPHTYLNMATAILLGVAAAAFRL